MSGEPRSFDIGVAVRGGGVLKVSKLEVESGPGEIATWGAPNERLTVRTKPGTLIYSLNILPDRLEEVGRMTFGPSFRLPPRPIAAPPRGLGLSLARNLRTVFSELRELEKTGLSALALGPYGDLLAGLALAIIRPDLLSADMEAESEPHCLVSRAEEILHERALEPLSVASVAAELGVTARTLQLAFRRQRGCTPLQALINRRMELARERLLNPELRANVQSIAMSCGIANVGRFSARYKTMFGELPSQTLARARR